MRFGGAVCAQIAPAEKQIKVESEARDAFARHVAGRPDSACDSIALELLLQAARTKTVKPSLVLGAALQVEEQASGQKGAHQLQASQSATMHCQHKLVIATSHMQRRLLGWMAGGNW